MNASLTAELAADSHTHPALLPLRRQMAELFETGLSTGCALSVYFQGEHIAHLWGGFCDREFNTPWQKDTLVNVFSASKGILSAAILELIETGRLDVDAPIAQYWPAFATANKQHITTRDVLSHRAGLCAFQHFVPREDCYQWPAMKQHVERMQAIDVLQGYQAYAPFTFGWILGGVIEAITGLEPHNFINQRFGDESGLDYHLALNDERLRRVAPVAPKAATKPASGAAAKKASSQTDASTILQSDQSHFQQALQRRDWRALAFENPRSLAGGSNSSAWRRAGVPAAGGHCSADALARFYKQLLPSVSNKNPILRNAEPLKQPWSEATADACTGAPMKFSGGFMFSQPSDAAALTPQGTSIGHAGAGGSLGALDMDHDIAIGFVTRDLSPSLLAGGKAQKLIATVYQCLRQEGLL